MSSPHRLLAICSLSSVALTALAEPVAYTNETAYLNALTSLGYVWVHESFEDDRVWGSLRSSIVDGNHTAPGRTNLGVQWAANNDTSQITTSQGPALSGQWGFYALPHGNYASGTDCDIPGNCGDGITGRSQSVMFGVAAWAEGFSGSKLQLMLDGDVANPVGFPEVCDPTGENCTNYGLLSTQHKFFGVIEPAGFTHFEFKELEGKAEDQKFVWFDDFTVAFTNAPPPRFTGVTMSSNTVQIGVTGLAVGARYILERTQSLDSAAWTEAESFSATSGESILADSVEDDRSRYFYRLQVP